MEKRLKRSKAKDEDGESTCFKKLSALAFS